jgi:S-disulfanyl-L-cysteine oxidoreductase SoxD
MRLGITVLAGCAIVVAAYSGAHAQAKTVWDGVYTQAQAKRGEGVYTQQCATCHGDDLKGKEDLKPDPSPSLTGPDLGISFDDVTLDMMADRIRTSMPKDKPNTLSREQVADVVAFILSKNGMPAGKTDLPGATEPQKAIKYLTAKP